MKSLLIIFCSIVVLLDLFGFFFIPFRVYLSFLMLYMCLDSGFSGFLELCSLSFCSGQQFFVGLFGFMEKMLCFKMKFVFFLCMLFL